VPLFTKQMTDLPDTTIAALMRGVSLYRTGCLAEIEDAFYAKARVVPPRASARAGSRLKKKGRPFEAPQSVGKSPGGETPVCGGISCARFRHGD